MLLCVEFWLCNQSVSITIIVYEMGWRWLDYENYKTSDVERNGSDDVSDNTHLVLLHHPRLETCRGYNAAHHPPAHPLPSPFPF